MSLRENLRVAPWCTFSSTGIVDFEEHSNDTVQGRQPMRIWLIGADASGTAALRQLQKNPTLQVIVSDTIARPRAVAERVIARVDYVEQVTSANVNQLARRVRAELILLDASASQRNLRQLSEGQVFAEALDAEIAVASTVPCLIL